MSEIEIEQLDIDDLTLTGEQYLLFNVAADTYAIPVTQIREIIEYTEPTQVPMTPDFVSGIINLRGGAVPVINLACKFEQDQQEITKRTCIIIAEVDGSENKRILGCLVDKVQQVRDIPEEAIEPAPKLGSTIDTRFIKNMAKINERFIIILDINNVLSLEELEIVEMMQENSLDV
ncbi:MAG: chemotaxis protein CheW [Gammaproteobacteria bacterium]|nr:MAG: chemotaxis protein CheW [Gammaproteobacteria bacterium]